MLRLPSRTSVSFPSWWSATQRRPPPCDPAHYRRVTIRERATAKWQQQGNTTEKPPAYAGHRHINHSSVQFSEGTIMSITPSAGSVHLVIAGAGPAAQALVRRLTGNSTTSRQPGTTV